ncbi:MAG: cellobiose phosphorylase [Eubacteriales bacterium]
MKYQYIGKQGEFQLKNPELTSYLYFPLANEAGVMSSIAPDLAGDSKMGQNTFFMPPASCENLHNDKSSRNIWCKVNGKELISLTGKSAIQQADLFQDDKDETLLEAGFMYHRITRECKKQELLSVISSVVPSSNETVELMKIEIENTSNEAQTIQVVSAIPMYARSADNIRDHRHVTALLHRIHTTENGVVVNPTMTFDERGHQQNQLVYGVFGGNEKESPVGFYPIVEEFIGEGGNLENPRSLQAEPIVPCAIDTDLDGYEALGGICFAKKELQPKEKASYILVLGYGDDENKLVDTASYFMNSAVFDKHFEETKLYWQEKVNVSYETGNTDFDQWMKWVSFQPMLRRIYGCSFLPHHDYGKGGRGWRDLWQDCLALLIMNPEGVRQMLIDNFGGVRMDGTNATIIGSKQGEFIADRNNITRVWMDHGVWPFLTTNLYIQQTGDIDILLEKNTYFKDMQVCRGEEKDVLWAPEQGERLKDETQEVYSGTLLEHLLIQNLTAFYDVGAHNHIKIRGADWNDALDMADENGESVAFTNMYAKNMEDIATLLMFLQEKGIEEIQVAKEIEVLLGGNEELYNSIADKNVVLKKYCESCFHEISGDVISINITALCKDLKEKAAWIFNHVRASEWIAAEDGTGWYNGYYDNSCEKVERATAGSERMMLTSQVFSIMSGTASQDEIKKITEAADKHLYKKEVGGYRLNTNFHEVKMDLGRMFGFAYGQKENGAVFSHMTTMYGNALYTRGASKEAYKVIDTLYQHCNDFAVSKIYPGVPEYIDIKGRGVYHYLTGAASWILVTVITQMFGVRGEMGDLSFYPQLVADQFDVNGEAKLSMIFAGKKIKVIYKNKGGLQPNQYKVGDITLDGKSYEYETIASINKHDLDSLSDGEEHTIIVQLVSK